MNLNYNIKFDFNQQTTQECFHLVSELLKQSKNSEAIALLKIATNYYVQKHLVYFHLAKAYEQNNQIELAKTYIDKSLALKPNFEKSLIHLAQLKPETYKKLVTLAHLKRSRGNVDASDKLYGQAIKIQLEHNIVSATAMLQKYIQQNKVGNYLELGVFVGHNFLQIHAPYKIGVDEIVRVPNWRKSVSKNLNYFELTRDDFFAQHAALFNDRKIQAALINGHPSYHQALRDIAQVMDLVDAQHCVIMTNCNPKNESVGAPTLKIARNHPKFNGIWYGETYKAILWLNAFRKDLEVFVIDAESGIAVIKKGRSKNNLQLTETEIEQLSYNQFDLNRNSLLNLVTKEAFLAKLTSK